jgi:hypothetical protein
VVFLRVVFLLVLLGVFFFTAISVLDSPPWA